MEKILEKCKMCPRNCNVNRYINKGFCRSNDKVKVAHIGLHKFEETCISNKNGSGTIFFSGCNLKCVFCQNYKISSNDYGVELSNEELANLMLKLEKMGSDNINLVSPTIYVCQISEAIKIAKNEGLRLPIIYNTNGYENVETLKMLEDVVDVYLPDFKYTSSILAEKYSGAKNYTDVVIPTIKECLRQQSQNIYDENGKILKGVIIRHLILPNHILNSKNVLKAIKENFGTDVCISIMAQYFPTYKAKDIPKLNRKITKKEYLEILEYAEDLGFNNGYIQTIEKSEEKYVPSFDINSLKLK